MKKDKEWIVYGKLKSGSVSRIIIHAQTKKLAGDSARHYGVEPIEIKSVTMKKAITAAKRNPIRKRKSKKKPVKQKKRSYGPGNIDFHMDRASDAFRKKITMAKRNPAPKAIIRGKFFNRENYYYWDGSRWVNLRSNAFKFNSVKNALEERNRKRSRWYHDYPSLNTVGVVKSR